MRILLATTNQGKVREISRILDLPGLEILTPAALGEEFVVAETGATFAENATIKAQAAHQRFGLTALAEDSGLEVDALGGRPGIGSARFMGAGSTYAEKCGELLRLLVRVREDRREARFRCCAALKQSGAGVMLFEGTCEGRIALAMSGTGGFGYDPVFVPAGYDLTFADLPVEVKNEISHRARAFAKVRKYLSEGPPSLGG